MRTKRIAIGLLAFLLVVGAASAQDVREPKTPWGMGGQVGYLWLPNFVLDGFYDEHGTIGASYYGLYGTYTFQWFDLQFGMTNYKLDFEDANYLVAGEDEEEEIDYVEADLGMFAVEVAVQWRWELHKYVSWDATVGLGFGFLYGPYESYDVVGGVRSEESESPNKPPVVPIGIVETGVKIFAVPKVLAFNLDFGIRDGVTVGGGVQGFFY